MQPDQRGRLEGLQLEALRNSLNIPPGTDYHICMGDIFDGFRVGLDAIFEVGTAYLDAAPNHPDTRFVIIRGNHDASRDTQEVSAFEVLKLMLESVENVWLADSPRVFDDRGEDREPLFTVYPFDPFVSAEDQVKDHPPLGSTVFGHWDLIAFGENTHQLCPFQMFQDAGVKRIVTGHDHNAQHFWWDKGKRNDEGHGVEVICTGSMLPYGFDQDASESLYVTRTRSEVIEALEQDPDAFKDRCLRVVLEPGDEPLDDVPGVVMLKHKKAGAPDEGDEPIEVNLGDFDFRKLMFEELEKEGVPEPRRERVWTKFEELSRDA